MKKIIGITGLASSGKSTIGNIIVENNDDWEVLSFASHLKDVVSLLFSWDRALLEGDTTESREWREKPDDFWSKKLGKEFTPRFAMQFFGTNLLRNQFYEDIWVSSVEKKIIDGTKNVVITDVRFPNEIDMIKKMGGIIWRVERGVLPFWYETARKIGQDKAREMNGFKPLNKELPNNIVNHLLIQVHPSEWRWIGYDNPKTIFKNNSSLETLKSKVLESLSKLKN